jgi:hypothetical protein
LEAIYRFTTFKVVPDELMDVVIEKMGMQDSPAAIESQTVGQSGRRLQQQEAGGGSLLKSLNTLALGGFALAVMGCCACIGKMLMVRFPKVRVWVAKLVIAIVNALHNAFNTAALPIMMNTLENLKQGFIAKKSFLSLFGPILILSFFLYYPIFVFKFLSKHIQMCRSPEQHPVFYKKHKSAFSGLRLEQTKTHDNMLSFILIVLYRRTIYTIVIVLLSGFPAIQIGLIILISTLMMIAFINTRPFFLPHENALQGFNEIIVILSAYHLILISDFVPAQFSMFHEWAGNSMVLVIMLTTLGFLVNIFYDLAKMVIKKIRTRRQKKKFEEKRLELIKKTADSLSSRNTHFKQITHQMTDVVPKNNDKRSMILLESNFRRSNLQAELQKNKLNVLE